MSTVKTLLVVGGTGFIGSCLARRATEIGLNTSVLSSREPIDERKINKVEYLYADIRDKEQLKEVFRDKNFSYIVNLSGYVDHSSYLDGGRGVIDSHFNGLLNLVEVLDWNSIETFVQIGSSDEYGDTPAPQTESICTYPISPYAFAKSAANLFFQMLNHTEGFPVVMLRFFLVYGPGQNKERFLPQVIRGCLENKTFPTSKGEQIRDFCYIDDIIDGITSTFGKKECYGEIINLASGVPVKIRDVLSTIVKTVGSGKPDFGAIHYRPGENMSLYADCDKAKKILGWSSQTSLDAGIKKTIEYYKNN